MKLLTPGVSVGPLNVFGAMDPSLALRLALLDPPRRLFCSLMPHWAPHLQNVHQDVMRVIVLPLQNALSQCAALQSGKEVAAAVCETWFASALFKMLKTADKTALPTAHAYLVLNHGMLKALATRAREKGLM